MMLFRSPLTMTLLLAAVILLAGGAMTKKGHILSFFGAMAATLSVVTGLFAGALLSETLLYLLLALAVERSADQWKRRRRG